MNESPTYIYKINNDNTIGDKVGEQKFTKSGNKSIKF